jgi:hypothetical protein
MRESRAAKKAIACVQSNYIPWKGYFDLINTVDEFILYDDVQYTRSDWRNRNRIKTASGVKWLTIPIRVKGRHLQRIDEAEIADPRWVQRHLRTLRHGYAHAPFFDRYIPMLEAVYGLGHNLLSDVNHAFIRTVCEVLGIQTKLTLSSDYAGKPSGADERLVSLCEQTGAGRYVSGPTARGRLDERVFGDAGIDVEYMDYSGYPAYPQLHPPFVHEVSIVDLLFNAGPAARQLMKSFDVLTRPSGRRPATTRREAGTHRS